jgi:hypothetical protein
MMLCFGMYSFLGVSAALAELRREGNGKGVQTQRGREERTAGWTYRVVR